ncbi:uncharacterized protein [Branchiostoma lanceolatum]|uniref:uncharacterized protein isoform X2 n=1 Tax=Branchiostoma lanceolatum TaxID=7740 RepID=UPI0034562C4C
MAEAMEHRHLHRLYKCAECEFTVSHEMMVYVLRHFFRCTSNKYVDELEVWSPPHLKINGTMKNAGPSENVVRERHLSSREEEDSRTSANTPAQRRVSEDSRLLHSSHSATRQEEESITFANTHHTHRGVIEDSRTLHSSNLHNQRGLQNAHHSYGGDRATSTDVSKGMEIADVTPVVQVTGMTGPPMVWMVQPNANAHQLTWHKTPSSSATSHAEMPLTPLHRQVVHQGEVSLEVEGNGQGRQQENQVDRRQTQHNSETEVGDLCEEEEDENEEVIELNLSCSPDPLCNPADTGDQMVTMAITSPMLNLTQTPSILQQQHQSPSFDRMKRGRPQKPPYTSTSVADADQPKNTKRMNRWAVRVLNSWADRRNRETSASSSGQDLKPVPTNWASMTVEQLDHWLSQFVSEVRRDDGQYYPYNTLYLMLTGVNRYLRNDCDRKDVNILAKDDARFLQLRQAMETQKKLLIERGVGLQDKRRHDTELFPHGIEARLWESKVFSLEKDLSISYAVFYYTSKLFGVSSGEEHHSLVAEQFSVGCDHMGRYVAFNRLGKKNKTTKVYAIPSDPYCPVLLYEVYLGYIPPNGPLYRRLQRDPEGRMFFGPPVGKNSLATYLNNIKRLGIVNSQGTLGPCSTGPHPSGPHPPGPHPTGPHPPGPHPSGPNPSGPHPTGPHPSGPQSLLGSYPTGPQPTGPHPTGPHPSGPHSLGPHPTGPHPLGPHPTCSTTPDLSLETSPATCTSSSDSAKRHHSQSTDGSECSAEPSPKRIHTWNFDQTLSSYTPLNQS